MKLSLIILALYVGVLSCFPCQDKIAHTAYEISSDVDIHSESDHTEPVGDFCSPFCICACCATASVPPVEFGLPATCTAQYFAVKLYQYKASFAQANVGLIWQPPRLV
jgi:hypothetical protein